VPVPIIASINCVYSHEWTSFAQQIEEAGADVIELNKFSLPSDFSRSSQEQESMYFKVIERLIQTTFIPVALKIIYYFTNLGQIIQRVSNSGVAVLVLFNRFFKSSKKPSGTSMSVGGKKACAEDACIGKK